MAERLDERSILEGLSAGSRGRLRALRVLETVDSTNRYLLEGEAFAAPGVYACVAESQTAGRGRRGRAWVSPPGANLYLSVLRASASAPAPLGGFSLAVGVAVARALTALHVPGVGLKWPNDIQMAGRKLGGILVEIAAGGPGSWRAVAGVGINVALPADAGIDQPWTDLAAHGIRPPRNRLACRVLDAVIEAGERFTESGFEGFRREWDVLDVVRDRPVELRDGARVMRGIARGVDADGALLLETDGGRQRIVSGDVSLRPAG